MMPLLSIGVPTYNRAFLLEDFFLNLEDALQDHADKIEILISDNASTDETERICRSHVERLGRSLNIRYWQNATNLGVSANLVGLLYKTTGQFFTFIGDDDKLDRDALSGVVAILESSPLPSAVVQSKWPYKPLRSGQTSFQRALDYFYEYGNPACGIVDRAAAVKAVESRGLRSRIEELIWPQTVFGYLAMHDLQLSGRTPVFYHRVTSVQAHTVRYTLGNAAYWRRGLKDLIWAARIVDDYAPGNATQRAVIKVGPAAGFRALLGHLAIRTLIEGAVQEGKPELYTAFLSSDRLLSRLAVLWVRLVSSPRLVRIGATLYLAAQKRITPRSANARIRNIQRQAREHAEMSGVRTTNWF